jgi:molybdopterin synthase catalytic subunit/molybdopterin converting factor small subunit
VRINVLFFGVVRDLVGRAGDALDLEPGACAGDVFTRYAREFPKLDAMRRSVVLARNQRFSPAAEPLADGDEIALLPPVSGGSGPFTRLMEDDRGFYALTRDPIDVPALVARVRRDEDGAVATFEGVVRNNSGGRSTESLEYECYEPMAVKVMAEIGGQILGAHAIGRLAMVHRLGRLEIGETSVAIVASAPHRRPAFDAALDGVNRLKRTVPIWKKERFADGEIWVDGEWDESVAP